MDGVTAWPPAGGQQRSSERQAALQPSTHDLSGSYRSALLSRTLLHVPRDATGRGMVTHFLRQSTAKQPCLPAVPTNSLCRLIVDPDRSCPRCEPASAPSLRIRGRRGACMLIGADRRTEPRYRRRVGGGPGRSLRPGRAVSGAAVTQVNV